MQYFLSLFSKLNSKFVKGVRSVLAVLPMMLPGCVRGTRTIFTLRISGNTETMAKKKGKPHTLTGQGHPIFDGSPKYVPTYVVLLEITSLQTDKYLQALRTVSIASSAGWHSNT